MRYCHFCRMDTHTVDEDCEECGLSKPYEHKEERMCTLELSDIVHKEYTAGCVAELDDDYDDEYEEVMDDEEYEEGSYHRDSFLDDPSNMYDEEE